MATERPNHSVEISELPFEVRTSAPTIMAAVYVSGTRRFAEPMDSLT
jgi:hypothetical protein